MNYELAKKLKDAGFPQLHEQGEHLEDPNTPEGEEPIVAYAPSLQELVEACGERFWGIRRDDKKGWFSDTHGYGAVTALDGVTENTAWGSTPSEAVANLWLALNEK